MIDLFISDTSLFFIDNKILYTEVCHHSTLSNAEVDCMASCKTVVASLLVHLRYCSFAQSHLSG